MVGLSPFTGFAVAGFVEWTSYNTKPTAKGFEAYGLPRTRYKLYSDGPTLPIQMHTALRPTHRIRTSVLRPLYFESKSKCLARLTSLDNVKPGPLQKAKKAEHCPNHDFDLIFDCRDTRRRRYESSFRAAQRLVAGTFPCVFFR